ncbi:MAG: hypothetical protein A2836_01315 [Candidatus Taylorbacteria bacterium RIFCSPHIGHO2_01_FULL_45_63]|nr:MAG: hypothetical protein A2836_01315 [Candidatus Taylorbacteria bacterium RIFCSPHIGHO2_01_FULL_45_63]OHA32305.1 MAG: hypothetical protein A3A22_01860 [Candidatus Taylorbacteria bacterium RIFCSPLOWO2_01_FULL_45_34b]
MTTVTIPKEFQKEEKLVALPPRFYEEFLMTQKRIKKARTFKPTARDVRLLARGRKEFAEGKFIPVSEL